MDLRFIEEWIVEFASRHKVKQVLFDPWSATNICQNLADQHYMHVQQFRQGAVTMAPAVVEFDRLLVADKIRHGNHKILNWQMQNVQAHEDHKGNRTPWKKKGDYRTIDGVVASIMAVNGALAEHRTIKSIYATREMVTL